jgi:glycosyltransferase involved in cell wall biosynthesis
MKLTVIIPSRNRADNVIQVVNALANQTLSKDEYEVIVSDDGSTDDTCNRLMEASKNWTGLRFKYIFSNVPKPHTWNASIPRNFGALIADPSTTHFLFVDSDVVLPDIALESYIEDISKNPDRIIIGPYHFYKQDNETINQVDVRFDKFKTVIVDQTFDTVHDGLACFGGNLVIPRNIFWSVKGFSVDTHIGLEDGDMGLKLWKKGVKFSYDIRALGKHLWHETPVDRFPSDMREHINKLNLKHFHDINPDYGIVEASRDTYKEWGITGWDPPAEWGQNE